MAVLGNVRHHNCSVISHVHKVAAVIMSPASRCVTVSGYWAVLKINMIFALVKAQTIRVIEPAVRRFDMKSLTPFCVLYSFSVFQFFFVIHLYPLLLAH